MLSTLLAVALSVAVGRLVWLLVDFVWEVAIEFLTGQDELQFGFRKDD